VRRTRRRVKRDIQGLRQKLLNDLEDLFDMAKDFAENKPDDEQTATLKKALGTPNDYKEMTPKQRQVWARIAAYTAQVMNSLTKSFDESQVTEDLKRLEKMVNEAMAKEKGGGSPAAD
jgi:hypothetical protein